MIMKPYLFRHNDKVICAELTQRSEGGEELQFCWVVSPEAGLLQPGLLRSSCVRWVSEGELSTRLLRGPELCCAGNGKGKRAVLTQQRGGESGKPVWQGD